MFYKEHVIAFQIKFEQLLSVTLSPATQLHSHNTQTRTLSTNDEEVGYPGVSMGLSPSVAAPPLPDNSVSAGSN